jgi:acyl-CoA thioesterase-2
VNPVLAEMLALLEVEAVETDVFLAAPYRASEHVFGGQVMAQALRAAGRTVQDGRHVHSLHGYFLRPGDHERPIVLEVERTRDGRSFSTRRVVAIQHGRAIFEMSTSWQDPEPGLEHAAPLPAVAPPEELPLERDVYAKIARKHPRVERFAFRYQAIDSAQVEGRLMIDPEPREPFKHTWVRTTDPLPDDPLLHACVLAYVSDMDFMSTSLLPHGGGVSRERRGASLDHALWFHRPFRVDEWLLFGKDSPNAGHGRGFVRGTFHDRAGRLVVSAIQECMIREVRPDR